MSFSNISDSTWGHNGRKIVSVWRRDASHRNFLILPRYSCSSSKSWASKTKTFFSCSKVKTHKQQTPFQYWREPNFVLFCSFPQVLTWSQVTTSCTSTRVRTLMGRCWRVYKATRPQSESRAAGTVSSWRSDRTPHWACLALLSNIEVTQPENCLFFPPAYLKQRATRGCSSSHRRLTARTGPGFQSWSQYHSAWSLLFSMSSLLGSLDFLSHSKDMHEWLIEFTKLAKDVVVSVEECWVPPWLTAHLSRLLPRPHPWQMG